MRRLLLLLGLVFPILAQSQTITVSEPISIRNDVDYELIGELEGKVLLFQNRSSRFYIKAFDSEMSEAWEKEIRLDDRRPVVLGTLGRRDDFSILYYYRDKGDYKLKLHTYDAAANLIDSTTLKNFGAFLSYPNFEVIRSEDRTKIMVFRVTGYNDYEAMIIDVNTLKITWDVSFAVDGMVYSRDFQQILLSNKGEMFFILDKDNRKGRREFHRYEILVGGLEPGGEPVIITIDMDGVLTFDALFSIDNLNDHLVAAGMYFDDNPNRAQGYFFLSYDLMEGGGAFLSKEPFDDRFVTNLMGDRGSTKKNKGVIETNIREVVHRQDGGVLIIGERNRRFERQSAASRAAYRYSGQFIIDYYYDELFMISVHPDGRTHWKAVLPKKQYSQDDGAIFSSYFLVKTPRALRLIYNDEIKQENTVSEYVVSGNGEFDRNSVLSTQHQELRLMITSAVQTSSNELVIPSERRSRLKLVRVRYDD